MCFNWYNRVFDAGFGAGLANYSGSNAANEYFVKDRLIAEGVSGAFLSLGVFVVTEMIHVCTDLYTWRVSNNLN